MPVSCLVASCAVWIVVGAVVCGVRAADGPAGAGSPARFEGLARLPQESILISLD